MLVCHCDRVKDQLNVHLSMCKGLNYVIYLIRSKKVMQVT